MGAKHLRRLWPRTNGQNGREWPRMAENGREWPRMGFFTPVGGVPRMAENGREWPRMAENGREWPRMENLPCQVVLKGEYE